MELSGEKTKTVYVCHGGEDVEILGLLLSWPWSESWIKVESGCLWGHNSSEAHSPGG